jgi:hypothetical protein
MERRGKGTGYRRQVIEVEAGKRGEWVDGVEKTEGRMDFR